LGHGRRREGGQNDRKGNTELWSALDLLSLQGGFV